MDAVGTLRFSTMGSVDDGKSTLIGRLLLDAKGLLEDQLAAVERTTARRGGEGLDLSLFTDGLTIEREQGITVDVAYRYFATPKRRFIIADTPGHEQYTRNMVTGASTADLAIVLVDAVRGISRQTRRHAAIAALLGIPHVVLAVNKMDAVGFAQSRFDAIASEFGAIARSLHIAGITAIPLSALDGDMVVDRGTRLAWYGGWTLLEALENAQPAQAASGLRYPVQRVALARFGAGEDLRGYQGRVEAGSIAVGDEVVAWPGKIAARVEDIVTLEGSRPSAAAGESVTVVLDRQVDVARGDVLTHVHDVPVASRRFEARLAWMDRDPLSTRGRYWLKQGTRTVRATIESLHSRLDLDTLEAERSERLEFNDIGAARIVTTQPLVLDRYATHRSTGAFILVDEATHHTVAAGMITEAAVG
jgi:sulfate adenylyltransferase subunit 1